MKNVKIGVKLRIKNADLVVYEDGRIWRDGYLAPNGVNWEGQWLKPIDNGKGYMRINSVRAGSPRIHRLVAKAFLPDYSEKLTVDHIDGDKSNNCVENLRMMSHKQNMRSYQKPRGGYSKYRGVTKKSSGGSWVAQINSDGKIRRIGSFGNEVDAALAYNKAAIAAGFSDEALNVID